MSRTWETPEGMTELEADLVYALDNVVNLFRLYDEDCNATDSALRLLAQVHKRGVPITMFIATQVLPERGLL